MAVFDVVIVFTTLHKNYSDGSHEGNIFHSKLLCDWFNVFCCNIDKLEKYSAHVSGVKNLTIVTTNVIETAMIFAKFNVH